MKALTRFFLRTAGRRRRTWVSSILLFALASPIAAQDPSAAEILRLVDRNTSFTTARYSGSFEIRSDGKTRVKSFTVVAVGTAKAFMEFTNAQDRGTRILKLDKKAWIYFPKEMDTVTLSGSRLKEGIMGSDVSFEDALESAELGARYSASLLGREDVDGRSCWKIELVATDPKAPYSKRVMLVDAERLVTMRESLYARSGLPLKTMTALRFAKVGGRWVALTIEMKDETRAGSSTLFKLDRIEFDVPVDEKRFTLEGIAK